MTEYIPVGVPVGVPVDVDEVIPLREIILDTETTGFSYSNGDRVLDVACLEMIDKKLTGKFFQAYVNPGRESNPGALKVHGLTTEFLQDKPPFIDIVQPLLEFIKDSTLIIHNAPFDVGFLQNELRLAKVEPFELSTFNCKVVDTLLLARQTYPGGKNGLDALCTRYGIDTSGRELPGALIDCQLLAEVYLQLGSAAQHLKEAREHQVIPVTIPSVETSLEEPDAKRTKLDLN